MNARTLAIGLLLVLTACEPGTVRMRVCPQHQPARHAWVRDCSWGGRPIGNCQREAKMHFCVNELHFLRRTLMGAEWTPCREAVTDDEIDACEQAGGGQ